MSDGQQRVSDAELLRALGRRVRTRRRALRLSQQQVARSAGLSRTFVSGLERGRHSADLLNLRHLAAAVGTDLETLLHGIERPPAAGQEPTGG
jgi:transcriptional regulator with XRE-family HTH domain